MKNLIFFLIDDDSDDREIFTLALKYVHLDHICIMAKNGKEALEKLIVNGEFNPDYIFLDLNMPIISGSECLREIKKIPHLKKIPVIIYSTSASQRDIEETKLLGADHYVVKPNTISDLTDIIKLVVSNTYVSFSVTKTN